MTGSKPKSDEWHINAIKAKTKIVGNCWIWQGRVSHKGYGEKMYKHRTMRVHRLMYQLVHQVKIPPGFQVCHSCDVRRCCNPAHLWLGTAQENVDDMIRKRRNHKQQWTHCPKGHPLSGDNVLIRRATATRDVRRECRTCARARLRMNAGMPPELAYSLPPTAKGKRPFQRSWAAARVGKATP